MNVVRQTIRALSIGSTVTLFIAFGWTATMAASAEGLKVKLSGDQEVGQRQYYGFRDGTDRCAHS